MYVDIDARGSAPPGSVYRLIERYGSNLFQLHEELQTAFRKHTHGFVKPKYDHLTIE